MGILIAVAVVGICLATFGLRRAINGNSHASLAYGMLFFFVGAIVVGLTGSSFQKELEQRIIRDRPVPQSLVHPGPQVIMTAGPFHLQ